MYAIFDSRIPDTKSFPLFGLPKDVRADSGVYYLTLLPATWRWGWESGKWGSSGSEDPFCVVVKLQPDITYEIFEKESNRNGIANIIS